MKRKAAPALAIQGINGILESVSTVAAKNPQSFMAKALSSSIL